MNIHIITNSLNQNSGFSVVAKNIALGLKDLGHDVTVTGLQTTYTNQYMYGINVLPIDVTYIDESTQCMMNVQNTKADAVIGLFQSDADLNQIAKMFRKFLWYTPIEGTRVPTFSMMDFIEVINNGGKIIAQCNFGKNEIERTAKILGLDRIINNIPVIYHGVDNQIYKPLDLQDPKNMKYCFYNTDVGKMVSDPIELSKNGCYNCKLNLSEQSKCLHFKEEIVSILKYKNNNWIQSDIPISKLPLEFNGKFVFGFVGMNFGVRKHQERLLKAYSILINESKMLKDRTVLHLHCMPVATNGLNLIEIISELGIDENVSFSYGSFRSNAWSDNAMSILYNIMNCHVTGTSGEGFFLPVLESMSCGKPNIGPDFSSLPELIGKDEDNPRGLLADLDTLHIIQTGSYRCLVNEKDLALKMKTMYIKEKDSENYSNNAIKFANNYTWNKIAKQWDNLLKYVINHNKK